MLNNFIKEIEDQNCGKSLENTDVHYCINGTDEQGNEITRIAVPIRALYKAREELLVEILSEYATIINQPKQKYVATLK